MTEPVAWMRPSVHAECDPVFTVDPGLVDDWRRDGHVVTPLVLAPSPLTDERIDFIADTVVRGMEDGLRGFCRVWGWRQFARELLDVCEGHVRAGPVIEAQPATPEPRNDAGSSSIDGPQPAGSAS